LLTAAVATLALTANSVLAIAGNEIRTTGDEKVVPNAMIQATIRFTPGMIKVAGGDDITFTHDDRTTAPHTATIVAAFPPATVDGVFGCGAPGGDCANALDAHFAGGLNPVVNVGGPGLDAPGDSLLFFEDQSISAQITAPSGSRLLFLCAIHPWMQGEIEVQ
jgi:plastocyanin